MGFSRQEYRSGWPLPSPYQGRVREKYSSWVLRERTWCNTNCSVLHGLTVHVARSLIGLPLRIFLMVVGMVREIELLQNTVWRSDLIRIEMICDRLPSLQACLHDDDSKAWHQRLLQCLTGCVCVCVCVCWEDDKRGVLRVLPTPKLQLYPRHFSYWDSS